MAAWTERSGPRPSNWGPSRDLNSWVSEFADQEPTSFGKACYKTCCVLFIVLEIWRQRNDRAFGRTLKTAQETFNGISNLPCASCAWPYNLFFPERSGYLALIYHKKGSANNCYMRERRDQPQPKLWRFRELH